MTTHNFQLAVCAEMVFTELPFIERVTRIRDLGFDVEIWDWTNKDLEALAATGATFRSMTGYTTGNLLDGADELLRTAAQSIAAGRVLEFAGIQQHDVAPVGLEKTEDDVKDFLSQFLDIEDRRYHSVDLVNAFQVLMRLS